MATPAVDPAPTESDPPLDVLRVEAKNEGQDGHSCVTFKPRPSTVPVHVHGDSKLLHVSLQLEDTPHVKTLVVDGGKPVWFNCYGMAAFQLAHERDKNWRRCTPEVNARVMRGVAKYFEIGATHDGGVGPWPQQSSALSAIVAAASVSGGGPAASRGGAARGASTRASFAL